VTDLLQFFPPASERLPQDFVVLLVNFVLLRVACFVRRVEGPSASMYR